MNKGKKWLIALLTLVAVGLTVLLGLMLRFPRKWKLPWTPEYAETVYPVSADFRHIKVNGDTEKILFARSTDGSCRVECYEDKDHPHTVTVRDNSLLIERDRHKRKWRFMNGFLSEQIITVYLPEAVYETLSIEGATGDTEIPAELTFDSISVSLDTGDVSCQASARKDIDLKTDTGDVTVSAVMADSLTLSSDTGRIEASDIGVNKELTIDQDTGKTVLQNVICGSLTATGDTGKFELTNLLASGAVSITTDTGAIELQLCDAATLSLGTNTGDISGTLLSDKTFLTESDTGKINVPKTTIGGSCTLTTVTGDITIKIVSQ
ncbi:MAG: DUF4097 family beta strand repeat-containing protein [Eubacteriales bacterium]|nr:DUF4097 family beta strand repeat-containing protein [Eubacteriales bacterium]